MAYTVGDLTTRIQQRVRDTGYNSAEILSYINDTINDVYNEYRLPFMQATTTFTTAANNADLTNGAGLPTDYVQAIDLSVTTSGRQKVLTYVDYDQIDKMYPNPTGAVYGRALPQFWYYFAATIYGWQVPDQAYTLLLRYYKKPAELTLSSDVPSIPSEFAEVIIMGAAYRIMQVKDNYDQSAILQNKYDEILAKLVYKYSTRQTGAPRIMGINRNSARRKNF